MATPEEIIAALAARARRAEGPEPELTDVGQPGQATFAELQAALEGPGLSPGEAFTRGALVGGPAVVADLAGAAARFAQPALPQQLQVAPTQEQLERMTPEQQAFATQPAGTLIRQRGAEALGLEGEPRTALGRFTERAGEDISSAMLLAPAFGGLRGLAAGPARVAVRELTPAIAGGQAAQAIEEAGGGPLAQGVAALATGLGTTTALRGVTTPREVRAIATQGPRIPGEPGVTSGVAIRRAARQLQEQLPEGRTPQAIERIQQAEELFPQQRPLTTQVLGEEAGETLTATERIVSRSVPRFANVAASRRLALTDELADDLQNLRPREIAAEALPEQLQGARTAAEAAERAAWANVPFDEVPNIPQRRLTEAAQRVVRQAQDEGLQRFLAPEITEAATAQPLGELSLRELQSRLSGAGRLSRVGKLAGTEELQRGRFAAMWARELDGLIDEFAEAGAETGTDALRAARAATRARKQLFADPRSRVVRALDTDQPRRITRAIFSAPNQGEEATRAVTMLGQTPEGLQTLRAATIDHVLGGVEDFSSLTLGKIKTAQRLVRENRAALRPILGDAGLKRAENFLRRARVARTGTAGTPAAAFQTGSNLMRADVAAQIMAELPTPRRIAGEAIGQMWDRMTREDKTRVLFGAAILDPQVARALLEVPLDQLPGITEDVIARTVRTQLPDLFAATSQR